MGEKWPPETSAATLHFYAAICVSDKSASQSQYYSPRNKLSPFSTVAELCFLEICLNVGGRRREQRTNDENTARNGRATAEQECGYSHSSRRAATLFFIGHISPIFARFFAMFSLVSPSWRQDSRSGTKPVGQNSVRRRSLRSGP